MTNIERQQQGCTLFKRLHVIIYVIQLKEIVSKQNSQDLYWEHEQKKSEHQTSIILDEGFVRTEMTKTNQTICYLVLSQGQIRQHNVSLQVGIN